MHGLAFTRGHSDAMRDSSTAVPVVLRSGAQFADLVASVDAGASNCLFENAHATQLGLDLRSGVLTRFQKATSNFDAYGHEIEIDVLGIVTHSLVYFFADALIRKNVLGRGGWLDRVRLGLVDHDRTILLAAYDYYEV